MRKSFAPPLCLYTLLLATVSLTSTGVTDAARASTVTLEIGPTYQAPAKQSNVIVVLSDDQDIVLGSTAYQPNVKELIAEKGMTFDRSFANTPVCCPSRSSLLTGKFTHNHGAHNNSFAGGCASPKWSAEMEPDALAVHMQNAGYRTLYMGKYLNNYGMNNTGAGGKEGSAYVPPGWTEWYTLGDPEHGGNSRYYNYTLSNNGVPEVHGSAYKGDYLTDVLHARALQFLRDMKARQSQSPAGASEPFFMMIGTPAAHASFTPAPQYWDTAKGEKAPRTPNWNQVYPDKHQPLRDMEPMNETAIDQSDRIYANRLGVLRSVDDMVGAIVAELDAQGTLDDTYIVYTGDNGFHLGQNGMGLDKRQLYETDIRVPFFIRGPGVPRGAVRSEPVSHVDLAPTIVEIATGKVPSNWDGQSYLHMLHSAEPVRWRNETLIQYYGEAPFSYTGSEGVMDPNGVELCGSHRLDYRVSAAGEYVAYYAGEYIPAVCDSPNNTYTCLRRANSDLSLDDIYCEFQCFSHGPGSTPVPCPADQPEGYGEYYDLTSDPWQTKNAALTLSKAKKDELTDRLNRLRYCRGQSECAGSSVMSKHHHVNKHPSTIQIL